MVSHAKWHALSDGPGVFGGTTVDPDPSCRADRLIVPVVAPESEDALNLGQLGLGETDLAMGSSTDPDRSRRELDHPHRRRTTAVDLQVHRFRHRVGFSRLRLGRFGSRDPDSRHDGAS